MDFKFTCESLGGLESAHEVWGVRARFISGVESTVCGRGRRGAAVRGGVQDYWRLTESGVVSGLVVGGGVVGELVFRHSPTCQLVSDHRGK